MDLTNLAIFRAVALEQSVTRAAQNLQRAQSNVTTRIQQLEEELGAALFLREGKRMLLTERGRTFLAYAEQLLALADEARQALHPESPSGSLRLGSMESTAAARLPQPLAHFHRENPQVSLEVSTGPSLALLDAVLARRLDCALIAQPHSWQQDRWQAEALPQGVEALAVFREELLLVLPADHPPVSRPEQVQIRTLAGFAQGCSYRHIALSWLGAGGPPMRVQEVGSYHSILACVAAGACVGVVPRSLLELPRQAPAVQSVPLLALDTLLVQRSGYAGAAFERLREVLRSPA
ncbi:LysR substrate-binding domain-containing protein [Pseudomonas sp. Gutcm_11s]|uniref:LysR substrate-binding domain-containing protein n=1 Tax=Pseudomonas sp. Gutcm_11s TaxID=3026088 RepID=UPI00235E593B|nr:LysR substrate-binding domain-containing protein [Pseudomonas sp. Gutcm_11s]MDD0845252.1 LysR substrate-binding domain-containing protein [Pseudomonas sp. Gutcm_11s]